MKVYGYQKNGEDLIELEEVSIMSNINELKNLLNYLQDVVQQHTEVVSKTELCHSHLRDWDNNWKLGQPDIIIVTQNTME